jgi:hypothetical protein
LFLRCTFFGFYQKDSHNGKNNSNSSNNHWSNNPIHLRFDSQTCKSSSSQGSSCKDCTAIRFIKVSAHTGYVTNVVANVVSDGSGVARIVFGNAGFSFTNEVSAYIGSLGEDAAANAGKQSL